MTKRLSVRRDKQIGKELERMGAGKVNSQYLGETFSVTERFVSSRINTEQMRVYYTKIGDKELLAALEETISFFELQKAYNKPEKTSYVFNFNDSNNRVEFAMHWERYSEEEKDETCLHDFCEKLDKMGCAQKAAELKFKAIFSLGEALEEMPNILREVYRAVKTSIEIIEADLFVRIKYTIRKEKKKYAEIAG